MFAQGVRKNLLIGSEPDGTNVCCSSRQIIQKMNGSAGFSRLGMRGEVRHHYLPRIHRK
jgi:hypothetical protein